LYTISFDGRSAPAEQLVGQVMGPLDHVGAQAVAEIAEIAEIAEVAQGVLGPVAAAAPGMGLGVGIDPRAAFSDALASFAHESAALGAIMAEAAAGGSLSSHGRAWAVTAGVLVADAFLIGAWHTHARAKRRAKRAAVAGMFSIVPVAR
jgi:hypothetical protein